MVISDLSEFMSRSNIVVTVVAFVDSGEMVTLGDRKLLESDYLVSTLFDCLTVKQIDASLEGQLLPRMAQQGKVCGVICKPDENSIVGMYYHDESDVVHRYYFSKALDAELRKVWGYPCP